MFQASTTRCKHSQTRHIKAGFLFTSILTCWQFIIPLQKRIKAEGKNYSKMEEDFKSLSKTYKSELKKAGLSTVKAQQRAIKGKPGTVWRYVKHQSLV